MGDQLGADVNSLFFFKLFLHLWRKINHEVEIDCKYRKRIELFLNFLTKSGRVRYDQLECSTGHAYERTQPLTDILGSVTGIQVATRKLTFEFDPHWAYFLLLHRREQENRRSQCPSQSRFQESDREAAYTFNCACFHFLLRQVYHLYKIEIKVTHLRVAVAKLLINHVIVTVQFILIYDSAAR